MRMFYKHYGEEIKKKYMFKNAFNLCFKHLKGMQ